MMLDNVVRSRHPLDPLSKAEFETTVAVVRRSEIAGEGLRFVTIMLDEPAKDSVRAFDAGAEPPRRQAAVVAFDRASGFTYEVLVDTDDAVIVELRKIEGVQPAILFEEYGEVEELVKRHPDFHAALRRRGLDPDAINDLITVDPVPAGNFGIAEEEGKRLCRAQVWIRPNEGGNSYARPLEGVIGLVNLGEGKVVRIDDNGVVPVPTGTGEFRASRVGALRNTIKPLAITQSAGPSFAVNGNEIRWQGWRLRVGFNAREGLVLHRIGFEEGGRFRSVLHRAAYSEMVVPYGDPSPSRYIQGPFDFGENLVGMLANSLELGCDCLGEIHYFDADIVNSAGETVHLKNVICLHEEDTSLLWKHWDFRSDETEVRRGRRLVVSSISTIGNYDYAFYWYFYQDGSIESETKATGILSTGAYDPAGEEPKHGVVLEKGLYAMHHQHFYNVRLDFELDGVNNSVYQVHAEPTPPGPANPYGNAFHSVSKLLERESEAPAHVDQLEARVWRIVNPNVLNAVGKPIAYRLLPGDNVRSMVQPDSSRAKRAGFIGKHVWVTRYAPRELFAAGEYPNQHPGGAGLPEWIAADRSIVNEDIVLWYTFGMHHVARLEEWPIMPVSSAGFRLVPDGFFDRNPTLDVPPPAPACCH